MSNLSQKLTRGKLKFQDKVIKKVLSNNWDSFNNKPIISGSIIATFLALSPFLFTIYEVAPDTKVWSTSWFTYESPYYESVKVFAWTLTSKFIPLFLIILWFLTNRHWWFHALLVPIAMYIYQIIVVINDDTVFADTDEQKFYLVPVMAIVIPSIYLIRAKMFNKLNNADKTLEELEQEFMIKPKGLWNNIKQYF